MRGHNVALQLFVDVKTHGQFHKQLAPAEWHQSHEYQSHYHMADPKNFNHIVHSFYVFPF